MSNIDFPDSPSNGEEFSTNGIIYIHSDGIWSRKNPEGVTHLDRYALTGKGSVLSASASSQIIELTTSVNDGYGLSASASMTAGLTWIPTPATTAFSIDGIGDVSIGTPSSGSLMMWDGSTWVDSNALYAGIFSINSITSPYTLVGSDVDKLIIADSSSTVTVTIPPNSSVSIETGRYLNILQVGVGQVQLSAGSGVTINGRSKLRTQYSMATLLKRGTDSWVFMGDTVD